MLFKDIEMVILEVNKGEIEDKGIKYIKIKMANTETYENITVTSRDMELEKKLQVKGRYLISLDFIDKGKYGFKPTLAEVGAKLG